MHAHRTARIVVLLVLALASALASAEEPDGVVTTRAVGAATVAVDPATGRLVPPTGEDRRKLVEALRQMIDQRTDDLVIERRPSGTKILRLDGRFANVTFLTLDGNGAARLQCVSHPEEAAAWLEPTDSPADSPRAVEVR